MHKCFHIHLFTSSFIKIVLIDNSYYTHHDYSNQMSLSLFKLCHVNFSVVPSTFLRWSRRWLGITSRFPQYSRFASCSCCSSRKFWCQRSSQSRGRKRSSKSQRFTTTKSSSTTATSWTSSQSQRWRANARSYTCFRLRQYGAHTASQR